MWKVCQNPETGDKILVHVGYDTPEGYFEITVTDAQNYIEDEKKALVASLGGVYDPSTPIVDYFTKRVDDIADMVYTFAVSSPAKLQEYNQAATDAEAYLKDMTVPQPFVRVWAEATGWTDLEAAQDILRTAAIFKGAMLYIRTQRLAAKEKMKRVSGNIDEMKVILAEYTALMERLKGQIATA